MHLLLVLVAWSRHGLVIKSDFGLKQSNQGRSQWFNCQRQCLHCRDNERRPRALRRRVRLPFLEGRRGKGGREAPEEVRAGGRLPWTAPSPALLSAERALVLTLLGN